MVRDAYELSQSLFVGQYRPSGKSFVSHLLGTASTLASWGQSPPLVVAGLLHSIYLYGEFGDRQRGVSSAKREYVMNLLGDEVEALVYTYTENKGVRPWDTEDLNVRKLLLADLRDEIADFGPAYATAKPVPEIRDLDDALIVRIMDLVRDTVGQDAVAEYQKGLERLQTMQVVSVLQTDSVASCAVRMGVEGFKKKKKKKLLKRLLRLSEK